MVNALISYIPSPDDSRWIPIPELAAFYIGLCLWWGLQNRVSAARWSFHRKFIIPFTCYAYDMADSIVNIVVTAQFLTTTALIFAKEVIVVVIAPPRFAINGAW